jgi:hypothetical protein
MAFNTSTFRHADWAVMATGIVSLIALFLPWWGVSVLGYSASISGWRTSYGWLGGLLVVVGAAWFVLHRGGIRLPELPVSRLTAALGATILGLVIILVRWATLPRGGYLGRDFNYGGRAGIWIAAIAAAVQAGVLAGAFRRSGEHLPWKTPR